MSKQFPAEREASRVQRTRAPCKYKPPGILKRKDVALFVVNWAFDIPKMLTKYFLDSREVARLPPGALLRRPGMCFSYPARRPDTRALVHSREMDSTFRMRRIREVINEGHFPELEAFSLQCAQVATQRDERVTGHVKDLLVFRHEPYCAVVKAGTGWIH